MRRATSIRPGYTLVELIVALCVFVLAIMFIIPAIGTRTGDPPSAACGFARPSSHHVGVCDFAFCDGRVRAINNDISYAVYQALMTPRGRNAAYTDRTAADGSPLLLPAGHAARQTLHEDAVQ